MTDLAHALVCKKLSISLASSLIDSISLNETSTSLHNVSTASLEAWETPELKPNSLETAFSAPSSATLNF